MLLLSASLVVAFCSQVCLNKRISRAGFAIDNPPSVRPSEDLGPREEGMATSNQTNSPCSMKYLGLGALRRGWSKLPGKNRGKKSRKLRHRLFGGGGGSQSRVVVDVIATSLTASPSPSPPCLRVALTSNNLSATADDGVPDEESARHPQPGPYLG